MLMISIRSDEADAVWAADLRAFDVTDSIGQVGRAVYSDRSDGASGSTEYLSIKYLTLEEIRGKPDSKSIKANFACKLKGHK